MTIKPEVRARVIELHLQGMKRDDIQRNVGNISTGSIHNILEAYKSSGTGGGIGSIADVTTNINTVKAQEQTSATTGRPRYSGMGQANIDQSNLVIVKRDGGPLSQFLPSDTDTTTVDPNPIAKAKITTPALAAVITNDKKEKVMSSADNNSPVLYPNQGN
jgi:hypothetical protein